MNVRKVLIPAAGFGTRTLPASKAIPKEMITLVDRPLIQYAVEEAAGAGIGQVGSWKRSGRSPAWPNSPTSCSRSSWAWGTPS